MFTVLWRIYRCLHSGVRNSYERIYDQNRGYVLVITVTSVACVKDELRRNLNMDSDQECCILRSLVSEVRQRWIPIFLTRLNVYGIHSIAAANGECLDIITFVSLTAFCIHFFVVKIEKAV
jgi:hypothetical protein